MAVDPKYLREHYASLSDEALSEIKRADLVAAAQQCFDEELRRRKDAHKTAHPALESQEPADEDLEFDTEPVADGDKPDWLEDGAAVFSRVDLPGALPAADIADARDALEAAGIPCFVDFSEMPPEKEAPPSATHIWRVLVPGNLNLWATSVLERDIFNHDYESEWKAHLETLSDAELRVMRPETAFCGLFDRVERVTRAYDEELTRRKLK